MSYEIPFFIDSVNAVLGTEPDAFIPSSMFELPLYSRDVLIELEKKFPGIADIPEADEKRPHADLAIIYATALKLLPFYKQQVLKIESTPAAKTERFEIDWSELQESLRAGLDSALGELDPDYAADMGAGFVGFRLTFSGGKC